MTEELPKLSLGEAVVLYDDAGNAIGDDNPLAVSATLGSGGIGANDDAAYTDSTGAADGSLVSIGKGEFVELSAINAKLPASLGVKTGAGSVSIVPASDAAFVLGAGSALIGKVSIDQTTPGTTNAVQATNLPTTVDTNSGSKSASTLRVVLATDQPALTSPLLVDPSGVTSPVKGGTASGSSVANAPVTVGGRAATAAPSAVSDGQVVNAMFTKHGKVVAVGAPRSFLGQQHTTITTSTSETTIVTAGSSGVFNDLYGLILANTSATAIYVTIKDATSGTTRAVIQVPAGDTRGFMLAVDSAVPQTTAANNWTATCSGSISSLEVTAFYVQNT